MLKSLTQDVDPITLEVIRHRLQALTQQVETNIVRTAFSPLIYEYKDYAVGIADAQGRLIAQGRGGIPLFVANIIGLAVQDGLALYGDDFERGDVIICNYSGVLGQHLNNVAMYTPIVTEEGKLFGFMSVVAHWADVGGRAIGSSTLTDTTDILQEGVQLRTLKLWRKGEPNDEIYRIIRHNTRLPDMVLGDCEAQIAGCLQGRDAFEGMLMTYGITTLETAIHEIWNQSEQIACDIIRDIPNGDYHAEAFLDDDGVDRGKRVHIPITVSVRGETITVDYSKIAEQLRGPFNSGSQGGGMTAARMALNFIINPHDGCNDGTYRPLKVILPDGKFLSADATAPMAKYSAPLATVIDVIITAVAEALPGRVVAGHHGTFGVHNFFGRDPRTKRLFNNLETAQGGWGASSHSDGAGPFKTYAHGDTLNVPVELQEALYPIRIQSIALRPDSGGAGRFRGGLGILKSYEVLAPCSLSIGFDRVECPPWGLAAGRAGATAWVKITDSAGQRQTVYKGEFALKSGDKVEIATGGGGGFGDPLYRHRDAVSADIANGYVTIEALGRDYGIQLVP